MAEMIKYQIMYLPLFVLAIFFLVFSVGNNTYAANSMEITNTIVLPEQRISSIAVNPITNTIYVGHSQPCSPISGITVIDGTSETISSQIGLLPFEGMPDVCSQFSRHILALNPETNMVYAIGSPSSVFVLNATSQEKTVLNIEDPNYRGSLAVNPITNQIYLSHSFSTISVIDGSTNEVIEIINEDDLAILETTQAQTKTSKIQYINLNPPKFSKSLDFFQNKDYKINSITTNFDNLIKVNSPYESPQRLAVNPNTDKLYAGKALSNGLFIFDTTTNKLLTTISEIREIGFLHVNPVTNNIHVVHVDGTSIIDGNEDRVINNLQGKYFLSMATNEKTKISYVLSLDEKLTAFDSTTNEILGVVSLEGKKPFMMDLNENTNKIYISTRDKITIVNGLDEGLTQKSIPPGKQLKIGIEPAQIKCKDDLEFVLKSSNNSPACVKPATKIKLIERGWAKS